ncbi:MAG: hypothetical protein Q8K70_03750 [Bacteroidota bacterium]|nr:hypothetical protein [Bacteroidota bacterium]
MNRKITILKGLGFSFFVLVLLFVSCKKKEQEVVLNNQAKNYDNVSTVKVENYINRIYIDLLGREPLDAEAIRDLAILRGGGLSYEARQQIIYRLMTDSSFVIGDSSYKHAYYQRIYDLTKARLIEGASESEISQPIGNAQFALLSSRLVGDSIGVFSAKETIERCTNVLKSRRLYRIGVIGIADMYRYMLDNPIYDVINMNSLNFVNASYDDLFFRFPTRDEFKIGFDIIEYGTGGALFGQFADSKKSYCKALTSSKEFYEGLIKWAYLSLIGREPTTQESVNLMKDFYTTKDFQNVQLMILTTDEYAQF